MFSAICQTCRTLSSDTDAMTQSSLGLKARSLSLLVWPPWMKRSSGGPSSASSGVCSWPIRDRSQTLTRRSADEEPRIVPSPNGAQVTLKTSAVWPLKTERGSERLRRSHRLTSVSLEPVANTCSWQGLKAMEFTSILWASSLVCAEPLAFFCLTSHTLTALSSPTLPTTLGSNMCQATSSTTSVWPQNLDTASTPTAPPAAFRSHMHTSLSSPQLTRCPSWDL
mmetsp:Transcript_7463/g.14765  ORF Transcript_7463/g.14765 Transcript_7463/m.14765 type:complete len:224 (+) Transcript_7463:135-806(+)